MKAFNACVGPDIGNPFQGLNTQKVLTSGGNPSLRGLKAKAGGHPDYSCKPEAPN